MTRVNNKKSPARHCRASKRYRVLKSEKVYQGKTDGLKNNSRSRRLKYTDCILAQVYPELRIYATCAVSWCGM